MASRPSALALTLGALILPGCGEEEQPVPLSCRQGPAAVHSALRDAPRPVTLEGTPLSACISDTSGGGALQDVGGAYVSVASDLADAAARHPRGAAALRLGYLVGAVERSEQGAQGVGYELGRRLRSEVARVDAGSPAFRRGQRAGRRHG